MRAYEDLIQNKGVQSATLEQVAQYYILTSRYLGTPLDRALISVAKLQQTGDQEAAQPLAQANEIWTDILSENLNNQRTVRVLKLMGDGLYYDTPESE